MTQQPPGGSIVRYSEFSVENFDEEYNRARSLAGNVFLDLNEGDNVVRFIPAPIGRSPMRSTVMHYVDALPGSDQKLIFACPMAELKQPCIVCARAEELRRSPNPIDRAQADKIRGGLSVLANVLDRSQTGNPLDHIRVLRFGKSILEQLKTIRRNQRIGGDFHNPGPTGFDIIITREGTGMQSRYKLNTDRNPSPLAETPELAQQIIDAQPDLETLVTPVVPEELLQAWQHARAAQGTYPTPSSAAWGQPAQTQAMATRAQPAGHAPAQQRTGVPSSAAWTTTGASVAKDADFTQASPDDNFDDLPFEPDGDPNFGG